VSRLAHLNGADAPLALVEDGKAAPLADRLGGIATLDQLIVAGPEAQQTVAETTLADLGDAVTIEEGTLAAPLVAPSKIACVGLNYHDHCRETGMDAPERPLIFAKFLSSLIGPDEAITWDPEVTSQVDWEAELAVIVGETIQRATPEEAMTKVYGYTAANDVSARDVQFSDVQWVRGKSLDTFCPVGPWVVTADEYGDPQSKALQCRVDGETKQDSNTAEMIFGVAEILSFLSHSCTLVPGDLVLTGTPWGCGGFREPPVFLAPGETVEVEVEGVGVLRNPVVEFDSTKGNLR
jgi:2-keto-4-pentenoate hydratase/2-oxohepta-3-ene-1,7-dioic acid hydratase in catechol pathway